MSERAALHSTPSPRGTAREAILVATLRLIANDGVDRVTHRRVAQLAGVSPGSTTHHFSGREELLREAFRFYMDAGIKLLSTLGAAAEGDQQVGPRHVRDVLAALVDREFADPSMVRAEYELLLFASKDDELRQAVVNWENQLAGGLAAVLERAGAEQPMAAARTLVNFVRGFELERLVKPKLSTREFQHRLSPLLSALCGQEAEQEREPGRKQTSKRPSAGK